MDIGTIQQGLAGLGAASAALPFVAQLSAGEADGIAASLATRGVPYVLAVVILALCWALYKVFGLFLCKVQEREDDLKTVLKENTAAINRMVEHCRKVS